MFVLTAEAAAAAAMSLSDHSSRTASPIRPSSVVHDNEFPEPSDNVVDVIDLDDDEEDDNEVHFYLLLLNPLYCFKMVDLFVFV